MKVRLYNDTGPRDIEVAHIGRAVETTMIDFRRIVRHCRYTYSHVEDGVPVFTLTRVRRMPRRQP